VQLWAKYNTKQYLTTVPQQVDSLFWKFLLQPSLPRMNRVTLIGRTKICRRQNV